SEGFRAKLIVPGVLIVVGLIAWFKIYLPRAQKADAVAEASERERKIGNFFRWAVIEDTKREAPATGNSGDQTVHPQKLRRTPSQHMDKPKEKGDENTACRDLLFARWPVTNNHRSRKPRFCLVLACGNRAVRFVCTGGSVRTTPGALSIRCCRARALDCHGF